MINLHKPYFNVQNDLINIKNVLNTKWISSGKYNLTLEKKLAKFFSKRYAATASSWTTAAYLLLKILGIKKGDLVMLPAFTFIACANIVRHVGADVVFVDIGVNDVNMDFEDLKRKFSKRVKCIMIVDQIGVPIEVEKYIKFCRKEKIHLIHDIACSLGSKYKEVPSGSSSEFLITSFHARKVITSGEGGMIICNSQDDYEILHALRSHGWSRCPINQKKIEKKYSHLDPRFIFINSGYNLRPTDIQAAIGFSQFKKKDIFKENRNYNRELIISEVKQSAQFDGQINFLKTDERINPSWFGLPILINKKFKKKKFKYLKYLSSKGIETRPIISGNFINQPAIKLYKLAKLGKKYHNAQIVEELGFFIGLHAKKITKNLSKYIAFHLLKIDEI